MLLQNQISDVSALVENTGLSEGDTINLAQNQLDEASANAAIEQLEERGAKVGPPAPIRLDDVPSGDVFRKPTMQSLTEAEACATGAVSVLPFSRCRSCRCRP